MSMRSRSFSSCSRRCFSISYRHSQLPHKLMQIVTYSFILVLFRNLLQQLPHTRIPLHYNSQLRNRAFAVAADHGGFNFCKSSMRTLRKTVTTVSCTYSSLRHTFYASGFRQRLRPCGWLQALHVSVRAKLWWAAKTTQHILFPRPPKVISSNSRNICSAIFT